jgi:hypothetical protein
MEHFGDTMEMELVSKLGSLSEIATMFYAFVFRGLQGGLEKRLTTEIPLIEVTKLRLTLPFLSPFFTLVSGSA